MKKIYPQVTVLMATYNGARFVSEQIESIITQTYPNISLIISDDVSEDETAEILLNYEKRFANIKVFRQTSHIGFVKNFEFLLRSAEGDYFALSDQDDIWDSKKIEIMMSAMLKKVKKFPNEAVMVHSDLAMIDENGHLLHPSYLKYRHYRFHEHKDVPTLISRGGVMGNTILMNNTLRKLILPFDTHVVHHDYWIALINELEGHRITVEKPLVFYRIHDANTSKKKELLQKNEEQQEKKLLPYIDNNRYEVLRSILKRFELTKEDKRSIVIFLKYLRAKNGWIKHYPQMLREGFFHSSLKNRYKFFKRLAKASFVTHRNRMTKTA